MPELSPTLVEGISLPLDYLKSKRSGWGLYHDIASDIADGIPVGHRQGITKAVGHLPAAGQPVVRHVISILESR